MLKKYVYKTLNASFIDAYSNKFFVRQGKIALSPALFKITHYSAAARRKAYLCRPIYLLTESYLPRNKCKFV